jgi:hypothetical protein
VGSGGNRRVRKEQPVELLLLAQILYKGRFFDWKYFSMIFYDKLYAYIELRKTSYFHLSAF